MRSKLILFTAAAALSISAFGCGGPANVSNTTGNANANGNINANVAKDNSNVVQTTTPTPEQTVNDAPTLTPVYKAYCAAMLKQDEAAIRKIYSSDTIKNFESQMKEDNIKSLLKFLEDEKGTGKLCEVRNEVITGDSAVAEIRADSYPNGIKIVFVKENGVWKMTNRSPTADAVKSSTTSANTGK